MLMDTINKTSSSLPVWLLDETTWQTWTSSSGREKSLIISRNYPLAGIMFSEQSIVTSSGVGHGSHSFTPNCEKNGELIIRNLPVQKGQRVEVLLLFTSPSKRPRLTARQLLNSELIGLWKNRADITDSLEYARQLREQAQRRPGISSDNSG